MFGPITFGLQAAIDSTEQSIESILLNNIDSITRDHAIDSITTLYAIDTIDVSLTIDRLSIDTRLSIGNTNLYILLDKIKMTYLALVRISSKNGERKHDEKYKQRESKGM